MDNAITLQQAKASPPCWGGLCEARAACRQNANRKRELLCLAISEYDSRQWRDLLFPLAGKPPLLWLLDRFKCGQTSRCVALAQRNGEARR